MQLTPPFASLLNRRQRGSNTAYRGLLYQTRPTAWPSRRRWIAVAAVAGLLIVWSGSDPARGQDWPQWRGPNQNGVIAGGNYPTQWNEQTSVSWKVALPGQGGSTPVTDGETAYLTDGAGGKNTLLAVSLADGLTRWSIAIGKDRGKQHRKGGGSNPSAVVHQGRVYAYFRSGDLACVDVDGKLIWSKNLQQTYGPDRLMWDLGTSPIIVGDAVVVATMHNGPSFLVALHKRTGDELWKSSRDLDAPGESRDSYTTPLAVSVNDQPAIAVLGADHLTLHNPGDGSLLGKLGGLNPDRQTNIRSIASPVASGNIVVCPYMRGETVTAVDLAAVVAGKGRSSVLWFRDDVGSDIPTPVIYQDQVIFLRGRGAARGTVTSLDLQTGKTRWSVAVKGRRNPEYSSSPVVANDHLYVLSEKGTTTVVGPLSAFSPGVISSNTLADNRAYTTASPTPVTGGLLIRTRGHLYKIGN